jgi:hypothetical protein
VRDEVVDLFYLPDFADGDAGDGVWTMMDTLDGKTRTLSFDNAAQVDLKPLLNQSGQFSVEVIGDIAQGIKYLAANPSAVEDFADYQIEEGGRNLGKIRVTARTVEKQTVGVSLSTLRTMVQAIRTEYEQWSADPTTPVHDANGFATGGYDTFAGLFSPLITDAEWSRGTDRFPRGLRQGSECPGAGVPGVDLSAEHPAERVRLRRESVSIRSS